MPNMDSEKYSLRQRQKRKSILVSSNIDSQGYASDNSTESLQNLKDVTPHRRAKSPIPANNSKSKTKAAPLSKYRRKTANARERTRMREINSAFETLRTCVPACIKSEDSDSTNEKLTKITTLRLAMRYIDILNDALENPNEADFEFLYECTQPKVIERKSIENFEPIVEEIKEKSPSKPSSKSSKTSKASKSSSSSNSKTTTARKTSASAKRQTKKQKLDKLEKLQKLDNIPAAPTASPIPSGYQQQESPSSNASSAYASLSSSDSSASPISNSSYLFEHNQLNNNFTYTHPHHHHPHHHNSMSDLSNLMLESDGESLNLSDRCFSPLQTKQKSGNSSSNDPYECSPTDMQTMENPLELSLRLMEPATNCLSLSVDPIIPPSSCISPLMGLESLNAFDLFHSEFSEQAALDLFLT